jgi:type 1 glutamine amidotransferase
MKTALLLSCLLGFAASMHAADKKIVFVAGGPSHGHLEHEYRAGVLLWQKCLTSIPGISVNVISNNWPKDTVAFDGADAIIFFCTGGGGHPAAREERLKTLGAVLDKGAGFGTVHYGVEVETNRGGAEFLRWQGGFFEKYWSVNPHWDANFTSLPDHPITRGVKPFKIRDEWYYHMRFPEDMKGVTPILSAIPPESTRGKPGATSSHGGNPAVQKRAGQPEHVMWAYDRPDGGRGFGFTGAHFHKNWGNESFRKVVLNAILWIARAEIPPDGVACAVTGEDLMENLDPKGQNKKPELKPVRVEPFVSPTLPGK